MKGKSIALMMLLAGMSTAHAENIIKMSAPIATGGSWKAYESLVSDWTADGAPENCTRFIPDANTVEDGESFVQTVAGCTQKQVQQITQRQINTRTHEIRNLSTTQSSRLLTDYSYTRDAVGVDVLWLSTTSLYTDWVNKGPTTNCSTYTPNQSTIELGVNFTQTVGACTQSQTQQVTTREINKKTSAIRETGTTEATRVLSDYSYTRTSIGTDVVWQVTAPAYSAWVNQGAATNCTTYTPAANTITLGATFAQTIGGCTQTQTQTVTAQEKNKYTNELRPIGTSNTSRTLTDYSYTTSAVGTKTELSCPAWVGTAANRSLWAEVGQFPDDFNPHGYQIAWAGSDLFNNINPTANTTKMTSYISEGYKYTRGQLRLTQGYYSPRGLNIYYYEVCRTPI